MDTNICKENVFPNDKMFDKKSSLNWIKTKLTI